MKKSATIYDVAKLAKVSGATVSRVINGRPGVNAETMARVEKAMKKLSFAPRWNASTAKTVGLAVYQHKGFLANAYESQLLSGLSEVMFDAGYNIRLIPMSAPSETSQNIRTLAAGYQIDAAVAISTCWTYGLSEQFADADFPFVLIGRENKIKNTLSVCCDDFAGGFEAGKFLCQSGHKKIGIVAANENDESHALRISGIKKAVAESGGAQVSQIISIDHVTREGGESAAARMLTGERPDAVIITNEELAKGFSIGCRKLNVKVPEDISLIGFEDDSALGDLYPALTSIHQPTQRMGAAAGEMLLEIMGGREIESREIGMEFRMRDSVGNRNGKE